MWNQVYRNAIRYIDVDSALLKGNPLGDPHQRRLPVYVPPQYHEHPQQRFPVAFYLTGYSGWGDMKVTEQKAWQTPLWAQFDEAIAAGKMAPMLVAFPDCFTKFGGSQYRNSPVTGQYADHVTDELVPLVDQHFRTLASRDHRAVMGKSSGGYGSLFLGMTRSDVFGLVCATAGDSYFELFHLTDCAKAWQTFEKMGGVEAFVKQFFEKTSKTSADLTAIMTLACAQAYSPNAHVPVYAADFPLDLQTGEIRQDVWQRWLDCDPVHLAPIHAESLKSLRLLYLDAGKSDEWCLNMSHRVLGKRFKDLGISHILEEFDAGHMNIDYRILVSLEQISAVFLSA